MQRITRVTTGAAGRRVVEVSIRADGAVFDPLGVDLFVREEPIFEVGGRRVPPAAAVLEVTAALHLALGHTYDQTHEEGGWSFSCQTCGATVPPQPGLRLEPS